MFVNAAAACVLSKTFRLGMHARWGVLKRFEMVCAYVAVIRAADVQEKAQRYRGVGRLNAIQMSVIGREHWESGHESM